MTSAGRMKIHIGLLLHAGIILAALTGLASATRLVAQDESSIATRAKRKYSPAVHELVRLAESWETSKKIGAIRALRELASVRSARLSNDAATALGELKLQAIKWGKPFIVKELKNSVTVNAKQFTHNELVNLQLLEPQSLAFVDMPGFDDNNLSVIDRLDSVENLTIQDCPLVDGTGFRGLRLPNLQILNLRGCNIDIRFVKSIHPVNLPKLEFINLKGSNSKKELIVLIRNQMKKSKNEIHVLTD